MVAFRFIIIIFIIFILFFVIITTICVNCIIALSFLSSFSDLSPFLLIPLFLVCSLLLCFLSQLLISRFKMSTISNAILFLISFSPRPEQQCSAAGSIAHDARGLHLGPWPGSRGCGGSCQGRTAAPSCPPVLEERHRDGAILNVDLEVPVVLLQVLLYRLAPD